VEVARWLADEKARGKPAVLTVYASPAVRVCLAAQEHGLDISGSTFKIGGEPYTPAKARIVEACGVKATVNYGMMEMGYVAVSCENPTEDDDMHLLSDKLALLQRDVATSSGARVGGLFFTTTLASAPKVMLNTESGDFAHVVQRDCGCVWSRLGLTTHLSRVRSYEKLTSESVTFLGSELFRLLEEVLPARFGGHPSDYQLVEEEVDGQPKICIVVSPSVGEVEEAALISEVLSGLTESALGPPSWVKLWREMGTLRVERRAPFSTATAKVHPLHVPIKPADEPVAARS
jgi:phenylacetate-coenzyme A ligase PaaK-like adenylate-forming protein